MKCSGCFKTCAIASCMRCTASPCDKVFCSQCVNPALLSLDRKKGWKCPDCSAAQKKGGDNSTTPIRSVNEDQSITMRKKETSSNSSQNDIKELVSEVKSLTKEIQELKNRLEQSSSSLDRCHERLDELVNAQRSSDARLERIEQRGESWAVKLQAFERTVADGQAELAVMKAENSQLREELEKVKQSADFISDQHDELKKTVNERTSQPIDPIQSESFKTSIELKIDALEQQARQCNLEIQNLPEKKDENLVNLLVTLGEKIRCSINRSDVISISRVRPAMESNKPKHIVVKLSSRVLRDNVLAAYRTRRGLTSTELGVSGPQHTLYVNEHLTLRRKKLFRAVREAAKQAKYKYTWISNATILVRKTDTSPTIAIHTDNDIRKIKGDAAPISNTS
ncbi:epidermal growth factor receptor substrate 15-like 1 [Cydia splendana]|uniref:epidermal growth factor receptor substrate 15-like 1 n=1 Tax=Cydia splendana TaxID=1100963 RepID=UPI00300CE931